jgi:hypothetical protein
MGSLHAQVLRKLNQCTGNSTFAKVAQFPGVDESREES